jgi:aminoglycoside phosphotransferase (APT) family kinase protein
MKSSSAALILPMLQQHLGTGIAIARVDAASGGCINQTSTVTLADGSRYFLKVNQASLLEMFAAEADGLTAIRASASLRAPEPLGYGVQGQQAGEQLAAMHRLLPRNTAGFAAIPLVQARSAIPNHTTGCNSGSRNGWV